MNSFIVGLILIIIAGLAQGTMGLGQKRFQPMSWEAYWFLFSILSMIVVPFVWVSLVVPDPIAAMKTVQVKDALIAAAMGACWGIGALMWAKALVYIGLSITYGIGMSMSVIIGSLGLLFAEEDPFSKPSSLYIVLGVLVMVTGVVIVTVAGAKREKLKGLSPDTKTLGKGIILMAFIFAFVNGLFSGGLNVGFVRVQDAADAAIAQGATPWSASLVKWQFVFSGGFIIQAGYAFIMMIKNKTFNSYVVPGAWKAYLTCVITAFLWFAALGVYGQASAVMGDKGPIIGWSMYIAMAIIVSNAVGIITGEWKGTKGPMKILFIGILIITISMAILGYAKSLN